MTGVTPQRSAIHAASAEWQMRSCSGVMGAVSPTGVKIYRDRRESGTESGVLSPAQSKLSPRLRRPDNRAGSDVSEAARWI